MLFVRLSIILIGVHLLSAVAVGATCSYCSCHGCSAAGMGAAAWPCVRSFTSRLHMEAPAQRIGSTCLDIISWLLLKLTHDHPYPRPPSTAIRPP
jgi:hypothetical protein